METIVPLPPGYRIQHGCHDCRHGSGVTVAIDSDGIVVEAFFVCLHGVADYFFAKAGAMPTCCAHGICGEWEQSKEREQIDCKTEENA